MSIVEQTILDDHQAQIVIEVDSQQVEKEKRSAAKRIARHVNLPGFRKGKAPYHIIQNYYGDAAILEEALDSLGQAVYETALKESGIEPFAPGTLTDMSLDPILMTFTIPLKPEVDLGEYRGLRLDFDEPEVTDEDVEETITRLRQQYATQETVERAAEAGDVALLDILGTLVREEEVATTETEEEKAGEEPEDAAQKNVWLNRADVRVSTASDATYPVPGFAAEILGMAAGDSKSFDLSFAEDDENVAETLRGKSLHFEVTAKEVFSNNIPELDDEFVKEVDEKYESVEDFTTDVRKQLQESAENAARDGFAQSIFDKLLDDAVVTIKFPPVMLDMQIDHMLEDFDLTLRQQGMNLDEYKRITKLDDAKLREDFKEEAVRQLQQALILGEVTETELITVTPDDISAEVDKLIEPYGEQAELMREFFTRQSSRESLTNRLVARKAIDRLILIAKGEAPEIGEPESAPQSSDEAKASPEEAIAEPVVAAGEDTAVLEEAEASESEE